MKKTVPRSVIWSALGALVVLSCLVGFSSIFAATKITLVQPVTALSFAPVYVAMTKGFFKEEGIDLDFVVVQGGPPSMAALLAGDAQFLASGSLSPVQLVTKGEKILVTNAFARALTFQLVASNRWLNKVNLPPGAPVKEKLKAMRGATLGVPALGALSEQVIRYYLQTIGGLQRTDFSTVAIGSGAALVSALETGQIDGFGESPPAGPQVVARGLGTIILSGWDLPESGNMAYETLVTKEEFAAKNPVIVTKVTRALARGSNYIPRHVDDSIKLLQATFKKMDPKVVADSVRQMAPAFGNDGLMTEEMWANAMKLWRIGAIKGEVDIKEGVFWTNRFITDIPRD